MISVVLKDSKGRGDGGEVHSRDLISAPVVYTREYAVKTSNTRAFLNDENGNNMAVAASFSGTAVNIHDGGDTSGWTGTATAGTWDFADTTNPDAGTNCVSLTTANNNDSANFAGASVTGASYTAITLRIRLDTYDAANNSISLSFNLSGAPVGISVDIDTYINTNTIGSYQSAIIPLSDLEIESSTFNQCDIIVSRIGGTKPTFRVDLFQIEELGGSVRYQVKPDARTIFYIEEIRFTFIDNVTGNAALDYLKILGVTLTNGLVITRISKDGPIIGRNISSVADFYSFGFDRELLQDDGTNTILTLSVKFTTPLALNALFDETINIDINDNLSGLLVASAIARGSSESINTDQKLITR